LLQFEAPRRQLEYGAFLQLVGCGPSVSSSSAITRFPIENSERMHHVLEKGNSMATPDLARSGSRAEMLGDFAVLLSYSTSDTRALRKCYLFWFDSAFSQVMQERVGCGFFSLTQQRPNCSIRSSDFLRAEKRFKIV
jgi:hypothetical protein